MHNLKIFKAHGNSFKIYNCRAIILLNEKRYKIYKPFIPDYKVPKLSMIMSR